MHFPPSVIKPSSVKVLSVDTAKEEATVEIIFETAEHHACQQLRPGEPATKCEKLGIIQPQKGCLHNTCRVTVCIVCLPLFIVGLVFFGDCVNDAFECIAGTIGECISKCCSCFSTDGCKCNLSDCGSSCMKCLGCIRCSGADCCDASKGCVNCMLCCRDIPCSCCRECQHDRCGCCLYGCLCSSGPTHSNDSTCCCYIYMFHNHGPTTGGTNGRNRYKDNQREIEQNSQSQSPTNQGGYPGVQNSLPHGYPSSEQGYPHQMHAPAPMMPPNGPRYNPNSSYR